jgi:NOL1/NOP2/sun family putative RNA methylase
MGVERYRPVVSDWSAFTRAAADPEPVTLRVNTSRVDVGALRGRLEAAGFLLEPVDGLPAFLRVIEEPYPVSQRLEHWLGLYYIQQAVTGVAPLALGAAPGERILDLCAAPGGKASHLAERLGETGLVVAAEVNEGRMRALVGNLHRLGHTGVLTVAGDGRAFPEGALFDRVLVDVPCSGEGNLRRRRAPAGATPDSFRSHVTGVQRALLRRAVELVRPGGTIVYVTCTFAPEENEAVVSRAVGRLPVTVEAIELDIPHATGLTGFEGRSFSPEMEMTWRLYPQHLDSGGLFIARLRREPGDVGAAESHSGSLEGWSPVPPEYPDPAEGREASDRRIDEGLVHLHQQMGIPLHVLRKYRWMIRGDSVWMHAAETWPLAAWGPDALQDPRASWRFISMGIRAFRTESGGRMRPTNDLLRRLDDAVHDRVVRLEEGECLRLLEGDGVSIRGFSDGYVAVRLDGGVIGRGFVRSGRLRHEIPRPHAASLRKALAAGASSLPGR